MCLIIKFPEITNLGSLRFPRQRLFYIAKLLKGTSYNSYFEHYYLRRNDKVRGNKEWSLKIFGLRQKTDREAKFYSISSCDEDGVIAMLEKWNLINQVSYKTLYRMGWRGKVNKSAKIIDFKLSK